MQKKLLQLSRMRATLLAGLCVAAMAASSAAPPAAGKGACTSEAREKYRAALAECRKQPFGLARRACQARADRADERDRAACRRLRK